MTITILAIVGVYIWTYCIHRTKNYEYLLARITEQDEEVTNRIESISVLKYAIFDNSSYYQDNIMQGLIDDGTLDVSGDTQSFEDVSPFCDTNEIYLAEDTTEADYMISGMSSIWVMIVDAVFILFMLALLLFILFVSFWPIKANNIPFFI